MRLTASGVDRARHCLYPYRPDAGPGNTAVDTTAADAGTEEHGHIEGTLSEDTADAADAADHLERGALAESLRPNNVYTTPGAPGDCGPVSATHARWLREWLPANRHLRWTTEAAFAIDPRTGETRVGPDWTHRDYGWAPERFVPATLDAWALDADTLRVVDWKTGRAAGVGDPAESGQLFTGALALVRHLGHRGPVSLEYVKVNEHRLWVETARVTRADLLAFQAELAQLAREPLDGNPQPNPGHWCSSMYCPLEGRCPATSGALDRLRGGLPGDPFQIVLEAGQIRSREHAAWQYRQLRAADKRAAEAWAATKADARVSPVPLGEGVVYGEIEKTRESVRIETPGADAVLVKHLGTEGAAAVVETTRRATKGRIEEAARPAAAARGVSIASVVAGVCLDLRQIGAMKVSEYRELGEKKPARVKVARVAAAPAQTPDADTYGPDAPF